MGKLLSLFDACLAADYTGSEGGVDMALRRAGRHLYVFFEHSNGSRDWKSNLDFPARAHTGACGEFYAHRGFLAAFATAQKRLAPAVSDKSITRITLVGYSHGAALALLATEYAFCTRPDLQEEIEGYGYGCPRVVWGRAGKESERAFARFTVIRNIDDIVTHLPPAVFGYRHVGKMLEIGARGRYTRTDAHRKESIRAELLRAGL